MAKPITPVMVGVDVSKAELVIARSDSKDLERIANTAQAIGGWLKTLAGRTKIALQATGTYHRTLATLAHQGDDPGPSTVFRGVDLDRLSAGAGALSAQRLVGAAAGDGGNVT